MKKKVLCLLMAVFMMMGTQITVQAEDYVGADDWEVTFVGNSLESNFTDADMKKDVAELLPGDSILLQVDLTHDASQRSDWYMTNKVIQSLEDNSTANGGAYTYILTFTDAEGVETELYNSATVGGEINANQRTTNTVEGLHQATTNLDEYFYLTRLSDGETATVSLYVELDGETQGNDYQKTLASLQMNFAVERVSTEVITVERNVTRTVGDVVPLDSVVKTGDDAPIALYSALALASGIALLAVVVKTMQTRRGERGVQ